MAGRLPPITSRAICDTDAGQEAHPNPVNRAGLNSQRKLRQLQVHTHSELPSGSNLEALPVQQLHTQLFLPGTAAWAAALPTASAKSASAGEGHSKQCVQPPERVLHACRGMAG